MRTVMVIRIIMATAIRKTAHMATNTAPTPIMARMADRSGPPAIAMAIRITTCAGPICMCWRTR